MHACTVYKPHKHSLKTSITITEEPKPSIDKLPEVCKPLVYLCSFSRVTSCLSDKLSTAQCRPVLTQIKSLRVRTLFCNDNMRRLCSEIKEINSATANVC